MLRRLIARPNDIEFSGERKGGRCNEVLGRFLWSALSERVVIEDADDFRAR
jgi:hypothetical protein